MDIKIPPHVMDAHVKNCGGSAVGATILLYRTLLGLTTKEVGDRSGTSATTISRIERGENPGTATLLAAVERALGVERGQILRVFFLGNDIRVSQLPDSAIDLVIEELVRLAPEAREPVVTILPSALPAPRTVLKLADAPESPDAQPIAANDVPDAGPVAPGAAEIVSNALIHADMDTLEIWADASLESREKLYAAIVDVMKGGAEVDTKSALGFVRFYCKQ